MQNAAPESVRHTPPEYGEHGRPRALDWSDSAAQTSALSVAPAPPLFQRARDRPHGLSVRIRHVWHQTCLSIAEFDSFGTKRAKKASVVWLGAHQSDRPKISG
jgi:hypothetical protein